MNEIDQDITKCLIIHGFGGGIHEVKPLADYLNQRGYETVCPLLKGHSATRSAMKKATYKEWIDSAEQELLKLEQTGGHIVLVGFSMGGLIAAHLASEHPVLAMVTINTPVFYWNIHRVFLNLLEDVKTKKHSNILRYLKAGAHSPVRAMLQFLLLLRHGKKKFGSVLCPVLIIQAEDDDTVRRRSVDYMDRHIASDKKTIRYVHEGGHLILLSNGADQVMACVDEFIRSQ